MNEDQDGERRVIPNIPTSESRRRPPAGALAWLLPVVLLPLVFVGCEPQAPARSPMTYTADAERAYEAAMEEFRAHNWIEAQTRLREVKKKYGYSKYARLAELRLADADFEQEKYPEAIRAYKEFIHDHRSDTEDVAYARSKVAEAQYRDISDTIVLPAVEERDQAGVVAAYKELKGYVHDFPEAKETERVRVLLDEVTGRLIRHELAVARFYERRDNYEAAVQRVLYALRNYAAKEEVAARRGVESEALLFLGETYLKMKKSREAAEAFEIVLRRYPTGEYVDQARRYLAYMGRGRP